TRKEVCPSPSSTKSTISTTGLYSYSREFWKRPARKSSRGRGAMVESGQAKHILNEQFARVAKAAAHPKRLELLDLLAQSERGVDALATATGLGVTTTSAHLQVLRAARLV